MSDRLLRTLHETAQDLHEIGLMDAMTMREFDVLCLPPPQAFWPSRWPLCALRIPCDICDSHR